MKQKLLLVVLAGALVAGTPSASAHGINSQGMALSGTAALRAWVSADPVPGGDEQSYRCHVLLVEADGDVVVDTAFQCRSNFFHPGADSATYVGTVFADGSEGGTDFRIDGVQHGPLTHATGHYNGYELALSFNLVPA